MKPLVSIITPCFNGETYLKRYFDSILNQSYPNLLTMAQLTGQQILLKGTEKLWRARE